jgi:predicted metalloprotease
MKWTGRRQSGNVDDQRGRGGRMVVGGGLGAIVVLVVALLFGADPRDLLNQVETTQMEPAADAPVDAHAEEMKQFVSVVLADTEDIWGRLLAQQGSTYREPWVVLFSDQVESACGWASTASGPFYCPSDEKVYIDLSFFDELQTRFGAPGDFAIAYVVAHEVGHHVQKLMGITDRMDAMRGRMTEEAYNQMSVRLELQADFLAGVWAHFADDSLDVVEPGDLEEALGAASAVGDDRLQKASSGQVVPDSFTHGTSAQRAAWFRRGFETGDLKQGDTFSVPYDGL